MLRRCPPFVPFPLPEQGVRVACYDESFALVQRTSFFRARSSTYGAYTEEFFLLQKKEEWSIMTVTAPFCIWDHITSEETEIWERV